MDINNFCTLSTWDKFIHMLNDARNFNEVVSYYKKNNLQKVEGKSCVYRFWHNSGRIYVGCTDNLFRRLHQYISGQCHNIALKDDLSVFSDFKFDLLYIGSDFLNEENRHISGLNRQGAMLYNLTNLNRTLNRTDNKRKTPTKKDFKNKDTDFKGFGELFD